MRKGGRGGTGYEKLMRKGEVGVLDTKSLCAKVGGGYWIRKACAQRGKRGTGYEKLMRKGGRGVLDTKSLCTKGRGGSG